MTMKNSITTIIQKIINFFKKESSEVNNFLDSILDKNIFRIYTKDGFYQPTEVQLEGKKRMNMKDFLNGFHSFENIKIA